MPIEDMLEKDWDRMMDVHVKGTFLCSQRVGREMMKRKKGSIVNISSISAVIVNRPNKQTHYNTAKAAISHLTKNMGVEWAGHNIRVNAVAPGFFETPLTAAGLAEAAGEEWKMMTPMDRVGKPHEIKGAALFLASEASSFCTGTVLLVDGGYTCW